MGTIKALNVIMEDFHGNYEILTGEKMHSIMQIWLKMIFNNLTATLSKHQGVSMDSYNQTIKR